MLLPIFWSLLNAFFFHTHHVGDFGGWLCLAALLNSFSQILNKKICHILINHLLPSRVSQSSWTMLSQLLFLVVEFSVEWNDSYGQCSLGVFQEENTFIILTIKAIPCGNWVKFTENTAGLRAPITLFLLVNIYFFRLYTYCRELFPNLARLTKVCFIINLSIYFEVGERYYVLIVKLHFFFFFSLSGSTWSKLIKWAS